MRPRLRMRMPCGYGGAYGEDVYEQCFDQGSATSIDATDPANVRIDPVDHWNNQWAWWAIRHAGLAGLTPTYLIAKANHYGLAAGEHLAMWAQAADSDTWTDFATVTVGATDISIQHNAAFPAGSIYMSALAMYPISRVQRKMADWMAHAYTSDTASSTGGVIGYATARDAGDNSGRTCPALPFYGFKLTNATANTKNKCILTAYNHPSETPGPFQLEGAVDWLLGGSPEAEALLDWFEFYVYPCLNPQGVWAGYFRSCPEDPTKDHNRQWAAGGLECVDAFKAAMLADTGGTIEVGIDFHSWMSATDIMGDVQTGDAAGALYAAFLAEMQALDGDFNLQEQDIQTSTRYLWKTTYSAKLALLMEQGGELARGVADWKAYGANCMKALAGMQTDNLFTHHPVVAAPIGSRDFNGTTDRIDWASVGNLAGSALTISVWAKFDTLGTYNQIVTIHQAGDTVNAIQLSNVAGGGQIQLLRTGSTLLYHWAAAAALAGGEWVHILATHPGGAITDHTAIHLYVNGTELTGTTGGQNGASEAAAGGSISIGGRIFDDQRHVDGHLAQVGIWSRVVSGAEITGLAGGAAPSNYATGLVFYVPLNTDSLTATPGGAGTADGTTYVADDGPTITYP